MTPQDPLAVTMNRRVVDEVYRKLRDAIVTGYFPPGAHFVERELTERLNVSRTPIREAMKRLEQEGLIVSFSHKGSFVRTPTRDEAAEAYEMRAVAEGLAAELAAQRATPEEMAAMQHAVERGRQALENGDRAAMLLHNNAFHQLMARAARNRFLEDQLNLLWAYADLLRGRSWVASDRAFHTQAEHEGIMQALLRRDAEASRRLNAEHIDHAWQAAVANLGGPATPDGRPG